MQGLPKWTSHCASGQRGLAWLSFWVKSTHGSHPWTVFAHGKAAIALQCAGTWRHVAGAVQSLTDAAIGLASFEVERRDRKIWSEARAFWLPASRFPLHKFHTRLGGKERLFTGKEGACELEPIFHSQNAPTRLGCTIDGGRLEQVILFVLIDVESEEDANPARLMWARWFTLPTPLTPLCQARP